MSKEVLKLYTPIFYGSKENIGGGSLELFREKGVLIQALTG